MTIVAAWTRKTLHGCELWFASDSRLSGGKFWDYGPKIFGMGRSDAVIAFAGQTDWAYPLISHAISYIESFIGFRERVIDLTETFDRLLEVLNDSLKFIIGAVESEEQPSCTFLVGGYSVTKRDFVIWRVVFHPGRNRFERRTVSNQARRQLAVIGDKGPRAAMARALQGLPSLETEPAQVLSGLIASEKHTEIGGALQITKIYEHLNTRHIPVFHPGYDPDAASQDIFLRGRKLTDWERPDHSWVFDAPTGRLFRWDFSRKEFHQRSSPKAAAASASDDFLE